ncbi:hypothetical protein OIU74_015131 [Salix koriyanagi]|uniref:Uncharacterized protein n=1 Tax=Salix koriyanagi TaxID=2511006 RepID=A0A9Q0SZV1_9ROSI|nr:hypothetical protein OIU74_015131 [Salix koriyanagi]
MGFFKSTGLKLCLGLRKKEKEKERAGVYCAINTHQDLISNTQAVFCSCLKSQIVSLGSSVELTWVFAASHICFKLVGLSKENRSTTWGSYTF